VEKETHSPDCIIFPKLLGHVDQKKNSTGLSEIWLTISVLWALAIKLRTANLQKTCENYLDTIANQVGD